MHARDCLNISRTVFQVVLPKNKLNDDATGSAKVVFLIGYMCTLLN
jgi:hypothetical protein